MKSEIYTFSPYIIPILIGLYIYKPTIRPIIYVHCICIFVVGIVNSILKKIKSGKKFKTTKMFSRDRLVFNLSIIGNLALILPLFYYKTIYHPNSNSHILLIIILLILNIKKYWPYVLKRKSFTYLYLFTYIFFTLLIKINSNKR